MARDTMSRILGSAGILAAILLAGCGPASLEEEAASLETGEARIKKTPTFVLRINCAAYEDYEDPDGNTWKADQPFEEGGWGYEGGDSVTREEDMEIAKTELDPVYRTERYSLDRYRITVPNGKYSVALHVAETYRESSSGGERIYDIDIEGERVLPNFDPVIEAGGSARTAVVKTFDIEVTDGELTIEFTPDIENPMINGIEIVGK